MSENNYRVTHIILNCFKTIIEERQYIYHLLFLPVLTLTLSDLFISMLLSNDGFKNFGGILFFIYFIVNIYFYCCVCYRWLRYLILGEKTLITNKKPLEAPLDKKTKRAKKASKNLWPAAAGTATAMRHGCYRPSGICRPGAPLGA